MDSDLKAELTCPICMDLFHEPRRLPCGHVYCQKCLQDMLMRKYVNTPSNECILPCPECRHPYNLTYSQNGVDIFQRDFKLVRLVELYIKNYCDESELQESMNKSIDSEQPNNPSVLLSQSANSLPSTEHQETDLPSLSSAASLSDHSWVFTTNHGVEISPQSSRSAPVAVNAENSTLVGHRYEDGTWLHPSANADVGQFPTVSELRLQGHMGLAEGHWNLQGHMGMLREGHEGQDHPVVLRSGEFDQPQENFQRFVVEEAQPQVCYFPRLEAARLSITSSSSESSSSDERDDANDGDVTDSASDRSGSHHTRRSKISQFFRSLVLSDTDSYDEDEEENDDQWRVERNMPQHANNHTVRTRASHIPVSEEISLPSISHHHPQPVMNTNGIENNSSLNGRIIHDGSFISPALSSEMFLPPATNHGARVLRDNLNSVPATGFFQTGPISLGPHVANASSGISVDMEVSNTMPSALNLESEGAVAAQTRRVVAEGDSSDIDYEPQTSMLRPNRKPRSRLKRFFTSLLSLSSSDEYDDDVQLASSTATSQDRSK